ncbi:hypothetical protein, partial [Enterobacter asburiae]|uniref:hypothetical protein n=1 Tax=Enterobacter asburiae TaxID=61645 RepID=UPI001952DD51
PGRLPHADRRSPEMLLSRSGYFSGHQSIVRDKVAKFARSTDGGLAWPLTGDDHQDVIERARNYAGVPISAEKL